MLTYNTFLKDEESRIFLLQCLCVCVYACLHVCVCQYVEARGWFWVCLITLSVLRQGSHLHPELAHLLV